MPIFISYSRKDEVAVKTLVQGLEAARVDFWLDSALTGGDSWWDAILAHIRQASVFLFAVSDEALQSKPCVTEFEYALSLGRPVLPVQVGPVANLLGTPVADRHVIPFHADSARSAFAIVGGIHEQVARLKPLPETLPTPPSIPYGYLKAIGRQIDGVDDLTLRQQLDIVDQLRRELNDEADEGVQLEIRRMLKKLRVKLFTARATVLEIDHVLWGYDHRSDVEDDRPNDHEPQRGDGRNSQEDPPQDQGGRHSSVAGDDENGRDGRGDRGGATGPIDQSGAAGDENTPGAGMPVPVHPAPDGGTTPSPSTDERPEAPASESEPRNSYWDELKIGTIPLGHSTGPYQRIETAVLAPPATPSDRAPSSPDSAPGFHGSPPESESDRSPPQNSPVQTQPIRRNPLPPPPGQGIPPTNVSWPAERPSDPELNPETGSQTRSTSWFRTRFWPAAIVAAVVLIGVMVWLASKGPY